MRYGRNKHHRRSIRLRGYDYSQAGAYFVTVCAVEQACLFGDVVDGVMSFNELGQVVHSEWLKTPCLRPQVQLDEYVVMPNHLHGVVFIGDAGRGVLQYAPTNASQRVPAAICSPSQTVGAIIRGFKSAVTKQINQLRGTPGVSVWQRNYYERVVRNEGELTRIRRYIVDNPAQWAWDRENPAASNNDMGVQRDEIDEILSGIQR